MSDTASSGGTAAPATPAPSGQQTPEPKAAKTVEPPKAPPPKTPDAASTGETKAERKIRLKLEGREEEVDAREFVDRLAASVGEDGLSNIGQLSTMVRRQMSEVGKSRKEIEQAIGDLREGRILAVMTRIIGDPRKAREMLADELGKDIIERNKPEGERKKTALERELADLEQRRDKLKREEEERTVTTEAQRAQQSFGRQFSAALRAAGVSDIEPAMLGDVAAMVQPELSGIRTREEYELLLREAAQAVAKKWGGPKGAQEERVLTSLRSLDGATLIERLGKETMRKIRQADLAAHRARHAAGQFAPNKPKPPPPSTEPGERKAKVSTDDWLKDRW